MAIIEFQNAGFSRYNREEFYSGSIGTSDCNLYIPLYVLSYLDPSLVVGNVIQYSAPNAEITDRRLNRSRQYNNFFRYLQKVNNSMMTFQYTLGSSEHFLTVRHGIIYNEEGRILLCVGVDMDKITSYSVNTEVRNNLRNTDYCIFLSTLFTTSPIYKNVYKKVFTDFLTPAKREGIDIIETSNIEKWLFKNNYSLPKFKTISDIKKYLQSIPEIFVFGEKLPTEESKLPKVSTQRAAYSFQFLEEPPF